MRILPFNMFSAVKSAVIVVSVFLSMSQGLVAQARERPTYHLAQIHPEVIFPHGILTKIFNAREDYIWLPPSDQQLQAGDLTPPAPIFLKSLISLCKSCIAPKWLPADFSQAKYLNKGQGAYSGVIGHLVLPYSKGKYHLIINGYAGGMSLMISPVPINVPKAFSTFLSKLQNLDIKPESNYFDVSVFPEIRQYYRVLYKSFLTDNAYPATEHNWNNRLKYLVKQHSGLSISYGVKGPINDPGMRSDGLPDDGADIWSNGKALILSIDSGDFNQTRLYDYFAPVQRIPVTGWMADHHIKVATRGEWVLDTGAVVSADTPKCRKRYYFKISHNFEHCWYEVRADVHQQQQQIEQAVWLTCLNDQSDGLLSMLEKVSYSNDILVNDDNCLSPVKLPTAAPPPPISSPQPNIHPKPASKQEPVTHQKMLARLTDIRGHFTKQVKAIKRFPCPASLVAVRKKLLVVLENEDARWRIAWTHLAPALKTPDNQPIDWKALSTAIELEFTNKHLSATDIAKSRKLLEDEEKQLHLSIDEAIYALVDPEK